MSAETSIVFTLPSAGPNSGWVKVERAFFTRFMAIGFPATMQAGTTLQVKVRPLNSSEAGYTVHNGGSELALPAEPNTALSASDMAPLANWVGHEWLITPSSNPTANTVLVLRIS